MNTKTWTNCRYPGTLDNTNYVKWHIPEKINSKQQTYTYQIKYTITNIKWQEYIMVPTVSGKIGKGKIWT